MTIRLLFILLFVFSCAHQPEASRQLAGVKPPEIGTKFKYIDYVLDQKQGLYYLIGEDGLLYTFKNKTKELLADPNSIPGLSKIKFLNNNYKDVIIVGQQGEVYFGVFEEGLLKISQAAKAVLGNLPLRNIEIFNGRVLLHHSKKRRIDNVGFKFSNHLRSDFRILRGKPAGFVKVDNSPTPFFNKLGFSKDKALKFSKKEFEKIMADHLEDKLLYPQGIEIFEYKANYGWTQIFDNYYFNHVAYTKNLEKFVFVNKIEKVIGMYDGKEYRFLPETKGSFISFSKNEEFFAVASADDTKISIYNFDKTKNIYTHDAKAKVRHVRFLDNGNIMSILENGEVIEFKAQKSGGFKREKIAQFSKKLARNIKLKNKSGSLWSVIDIDGERTNTHFELNCSDLLR